MKKLYFVFALLGATVVSLNASAQEMATFEGLLEESETCFMGQETEDAVTGAYGDTEYRSKIVSGSYEFINLYNKDYGSFTGFGYSNVTSTSFSDYRDQIHSTVGHGVDNSATFGLCYGSGTVNILSSTEGEVVCGFYISANAYVKNSILNGDGFAHAFADGDWFKTTITGTKADGSTSSLDYYIADYRDGKSLLVDDWTWVDLTPLGKVTKIDFSFSSTDNGDYGMNTPAYFCLDNFGGKQGSATAVEDVRVDAASEEIFDLMGRKHDGLVKGVNIIRCTDGSVRKVVVK